MRRIFHGALLNRALHKGNALLLNSRHILLTF